MLPQDNGPFSNIDQLLVEATFTSDVVESGKPQAPPDKAFDTTKFGREIQNSIPVPVIAKSGLATPELHTMVQYQFRAESKKCIADVL